MQTGLSFCRWRFWGWVYKTNIKVNTKWLSLAAFVPACHQTRVILTQPLNHRMVVSRNDLRDLRDWRKCKLAFPSLSLRCLGWVYKNENEYQMALNLLDNDATGPVLDQPLHHRIDSFTRNVSRDLQAWRTSCLNKLADLFAGWFAWKKKQWRYAKNVTNLKLLTYVDCKVTSSMSEDSPDSNYYSKLISRHRKRPVAAASAIHWLKEQNL